jgi:mono/diheme cytochrome c family protein
MTWKLFAPFLALGVLTVAGAATDGAALYKSKCSGCHGPNGEGKASTKAPSLKTTKMDGAQIATLLMNGDPARHAPHKKGIGGLKADQAKAVADQVQTLK